MRLASRIIALFILVFGLGLGAGLGQSNQPTISQIEAMGNFAERPTSQVIWSKEVGRIDSDQAHAVITALILQDATHSPQQMRGVRIDLTEGNQEDHLYTSEEHLGRLIQALDEISEGWPRYVKRIQGQGCFGSGVFWQQEGHAFSASQCVLNRWEGLSVGTGAESFRFTGVTSSRFADAFTRCRDELKQQ